MRPYSLDAQGRILQVRLGRWQNFQGAKKREPQSATEPGLYAYPIGVEWATLQAAGGSPGDYSPAIDFSTVKVHTARMAEGVQLLSRRSRRTAPLDTLSCLIRVVCQKSEPATVERMSSA